MPATNLISIQPGRLAELGGRMTKAKQAIIDAATAELDEYGAILVTAISDDVNVDTGRLQQTVRYQIKKRGTADVELRVMIGDDQRPPVVIKSLIYGSKPHEIRPKKPGGVLVFKDRNGNLVMTKRVWHPGTKPHDFLGRAFLDTSPQRRSMIGRIGRLTVDWIQNDKSNTLAPGGK